MSVSLPASEPAAKGGFSPFVLVHGAWHGAWCWERVAALLSAANHVVVARDLPGHGLNAVLPRSYVHRPLDKAAFATELSPVAHVTLDDYATSVIATVESLYRATGRKVILVGHSMGGVPLTAVAERIPEMLAHLVYLAALIPDPQAGRQAPVAPDRTAGPMSLVMAEPQQVGAIRLDPRSDDPAYAERYKTMFYNDVEPDEALMAMHNLTPDIPAQPMFSSISLTESRWGSVTRTYITCRRDNAIPLSAQRTYIAAADAFTPHNQTRVETLDTGHSPFFSQPAELTALLLAVARDQHD